jgi:hypothetical protein
MMIMTKMKTSSRVFELTGKRFCHILLKGSDGTKMKKTEPTTNKGPGRQLAHVVSEVSNPLFVAVPTFWVIALSTAPDVLHAVFWWLVASLGISIAPFLGSVRTQDKVW